MRSMGFTGATNNTPTECCPFYLEYINDEDKILFCIGCIYLTRNQELDVGESKNDWHQAYTCEKDTMIPDILYQDYEPNMPWE